MKSKSYSIFRKLAEGKRREKLNTNKYFPPLLLFSHPNSWNVIMTSSISKKFLVSLDNFNSIGNEYLKAEKDWGGGEALEELEPRDWKDSIEGRGAKPKSGIIHSPNQTHFYCHLFPQHRSSQVSTLFSGFWFLHHEVLKCTHAFALLSTNMYLVPRILLGGENI